MKRQVCVCGCGTEAHRTDSKGGCYIHRKTCKKFKPAKGPKQIPVEGKQ